MDKTFWPGIMIRYNQNGPASTAHASYMLAGPSEGWYTPMYSGANLVHLTVDGWLQAWDTA